jgi:hypothetical protein
MFISWKTPGECLQNTNNSGQELRNIHLMISTGFQPISEIEYRTILPSNQQAVFDPARHW